MSSSVEVNFKAKRTTLITKACGCLEGRQCSCNANELSLDRQLDVCGNCKNCQGNRKSQQLHGRYGALKCMFPPSDQANWTTFVIGGHTIKLHIKQLAYFRQHEDPNSRGKYALDVLSHVHREKLITLFNVYFLKIAVYNEIQRDQRKLFENEIANLRSEMQKLEIEIRRINDIEITPGDLVDSDIAHGVVQQIPRQYVLQKLNEKLEVLKPPIAEKSRLMVVMKAQVTAMASVIIQRAYRRHLAWLAEMERLRIKAMQEQWDSAIRIQCVFRGKQARDIAAELRQARLEWATAILQQYARLVVAKRAARGKREAQEHHGRILAAVKIQTAYRSRVAIRKIQVARSRSRKQSIMNELIKKRKFDAAQQIQRIFRGYYVRKPKPPTVVQLDLGPRVRELCEKYIARGDLVSFLQEVNRDYEQYNTQQEELRKQEIENASTFINEVVAYREQQVHENWEKWLEEKRKHEMTATTSKQKKPVHTIANRRRQPPRRPHKVKPIDNKAFNQNKIDVLIQKREQELKEKQQAAMVGMRKAYGPQSKRAQLKEDSSRSAQLKPLVVVPTTQSLMDATPNNAPTPKSETELNPPCTIIFDENITRAPRRLLRNSPKPKKITRKVFALEDLLDNFVGYATLRHQVAKVAGNDGDAAFERFMLCAPFAAKQVVEDEALELARPFIDYFHQNGLRTCEDLQTASSRLERDFLVPEDLAQTMQKLLSQLRDKVESDAPRAPMGISRYIMTASTVGATEEILEDTHDIDYDVPIVITSIPEKIDIPAPARPPSSGTSDFHFDKKMEVDDTTDHTPEKSQSPSSDMLEDWKLPVSRSTISSQMSRRTQSRASSAGTVNWNLDEPPDEEFGVVPALSACDEDDDVDDDMQSMMYLEDTEAVAKADEEALIRHMSTVTMSLKLTDPISALLSQMFMVYSSIHATPYAGFAKKLSEIPPNDVEQRVGVIRERLHASQNAAYAINASIAAGGFKSIQSLSSCPLEDLGVASQVAKHIRMVYNKLMNENKKEKNYDFRYQMHGTDVRRGERDANLPPVRRPGFNKSTIQNVEYTPAPDRKQVVDRVLARGQVFAQSQILVTSQNDHAFSKSYFDYKMNPKLGLDLMVATSEEADALENWHPYNNT